MSSSIESPYWTWTSLKSCNCPNETFAPGRQLKRRKKTRRRFGYKPRSHAGRLAPHYCPEGCGYANQGISTSTARCLVQHHCPVLTLPFCPNKLSSVAQLFLLPLTIAYPYPISSQPPGFLRISACPEGDQLRSLRKGTWRVLRGSDNLVARKSRPGQIHTIFVASSVQPNDCTARGPVPDLGP